MTEEDTRKPDGPVAADATDGPGIDDPTQPSPEDERVEAMLSRTIDVSVLASAVELQDAADAADTLEQLDDEEAVELLEEMDDAAAAEALAEMQTPLAATVIDDLAADDGDYAVRLLGLMASDQVVLSTHNAPPVAAAGEDQSVVQIGTIVHLDHTLPGAYGGACQALDIPCFLTALVDHRHGAVGKCQAVWMRNAMSQLQRLLPLA